MSEQLSKTLFEMTCSRQESTPAFPDSQQRTCRDHPGRQIQPPCLCVDEPLETDGAFAGPYPHHACNGQHQIENPGQPIELPLIPFQ